MSVNVARECRKLDCFSRRAKVVLLAMADHADPKGGSIYPSVATLGEETGYAGRSVQLALSELRQAEVIREVANHRGGRGRVVHYEIDMERVQFLQGVDGERVQALHPFGSEKGATDAPKGANLASKGAKFAPPIENRQEPSGTTNAGAREGQRSFFFPIANADRVLADRFAPIWAAIVAAWPLLVNGATVVRCRAAW